MKNTCKGFIKFIEQKGFLFSIVVSFKRVMLLKKLHHSCFSIISKKFEIFLEVCNMVAFLEQLYIKTSLTSCYDQIDNC